jgi:hypothetical protein
MVVDQSRKKNLSINLRFFFFYNSYFNKSACVLTHPRFRIFIRVFNRLFSLRLVELIKLFFCTSKRVFLTNYFFNPINAKKTIKFYNEGGYTKICNSLQVLKFYSLDQTMKIDSAYARRSSRSFHLNLTSKFFFLIYYKSFYFSILSTSLKFSK